MENLAEREAGKLFLFLKKIEKSKNILINTIFISKNHLIKNCYIYSTIDYRSKRFFA